jgi:signal transduction histidine kinase
MGKEVSCRISAFFLDLIKDKGLSPEILLKDIPYSVEHLHNKHERIDWQVYCQLLKNLRQIFSDEDFEEIGRSWAKSPIYRPLALLTRLLFGAGKSLKWTQAALQKLGGHFFSCIDFYLDEFGPSGFKVTLKVKDHYEFCREHFLFVKGAMNFVPGVGRYLSVNVKMQWIERGAIYENVLSNPIKTPSWPHKKILWLFSSRSVVQEIIEAYDALMERYQELEKAREELAHFSQRLIELREQERQRIANELHDDISGNLSTIALLGEALEDKLILSEEERKRIHEIPRIARTTAESMRDIVWFINPENDDMDKLLTKMRETANLMLETIDFNFTAPRTAISMETDLDFRRNLYLFYKECLQNIIKQSQAQKVEIEIMQRDNCLQLRLADDGVGFDTCREYSGNGLKNLQQRAKNMGGEIEIVSQIGNGTTIKLTVDIP